MNQLQLAKHFASGVNDPGEARGFATSWRHVGITATQVRDGLLEELALYALTLQELFVDSGAFSEVAFGPEGVKVVKEISDFDWRERFIVFRWAAKTYGKRARLVAPDRVGCQETTLARLARYAGEVRGWACTGAQIIVPVQKGVLPMSEMFRRSCEILGIPRAIAGVPMKKDATSLADLRKLVSGLPMEARLHLLGIGPESPKFAPAITAILELRPQADITSDSATVRRLVGRTNGPGGGPRALTRLQDAERAAGSPPIAVKAQAIWYQGREEGDLDEAQQRRADISAAEIAKRDREDPDRDVFEDMSTPELLLHVRAMFGIETKITNASVLRYKLRRGAKQLKRGEKARFSVDKPKQLDLPVAEPQPESKPELESKHPAP